MHSPLSVYESAYCNETRTRRLAPYQQTQILPDAGLWEATRLSCRIYVHRGGFVLVARDVRLSDSISNHLRDSSVSRGARRATNTPRGEDSTNGTSMTSRRSVRSWGIRRFGFDSLLGEGGQGRQSGNLMCRECWVWGWRIWDWEKGCRILGNIINILAIERVWIYL